MKKQMKLYLCLILSISFTFMGFLCYKNVNASTETEEDNSYTYAEYNESYKDTKDIPTDNLNTDTVFAGWYQDEQFEQPVYANTTFDSSQEGSVYAKFVDEKVLTMGLQLQANTDVAETEKIYMRLLTAVDSFHYQNVGFDVNGTYYPTTTVYQTVLGYENDEGTSYTPQETFGTDKAIRFVAITLDEIANDLLVANATEDFGITLTVIPKWTTLDGTVVEGDAWTFEINDFFYEAEIDNNLNGFTDGSQHSWQSFTEAVTLAESNGGTGDDEAIVITLLKNVTLDEEISIKKNMQIVNAPGKDITITRGNIDASTNNTADMFLLNENNTQSLTLGSTDKDATGTLTVDGSSETAINGRTLDVRGGSTFVLGYNATLQGANSNQKGAVIVNRGTVTLYGTIKDNKSTGDGGAILQVKGATNPLTIEAGTYTGNKTAGNGGFIGSQGSAGEVQIKGGTFSGNEATYGGVMHAPNGQKLTVTGGTFTGNKATAGGVFYVDDNSQKVNITKANIKNNVATTKESTDSISGGGAILISGASTVTLKRSSVTDNVSDDGATCDIVFCSLAAEEGILRLKEYESFDGIIGWYGTQVSGSTSNVYFVDTDEDISEETALETASLEYGTKRYASYLDGTYTLVSGTAQFATTERNYYFNTLKEATDYVNNAETIGGTGDDESIVITLLDNVTLDAEISIKKNMQIVNAPGKDITITRGNIDASTNNTADMFLLNENNTQSLTLGSTDKDATGTLTVDGSSETAIAGRTLDVRGGSTFVLGYNATLQGANSNQTGAVIVNRGTVTLYGTIKDNESTNDGGAILQVKNATNPLTIEAGTYTGNKTAGNGGFIGSQGSASEVKIKGGTFSGNEATYGGVMYAPNGQKLTVTGGTFTGNKATAGGVFYVQDNGSVEISNASLTGNEASTESTASVTGGGALCLVNTDNVKSSVPKVTLTNSTVSGNTENGAAGCDIVFNFAENATNKRSNAAQLTLNEYTSFDGIVGWYGAGEAGSEAPVVKIDSISITLTEGKSYTVNCTDATLTEK